MRDDEEDDPPGRERLPPQLALADEPLAARQLADVAGDDPDDPAIIHKWRTLIRVWAHRGRVARHGDDRRGGRRYDLHELTRVYQEARLPKPPTPPLSTAKRVENYLAQTGRQELTARQKRQVRRKDRPGGNPPATQLDQVDSPV